MLAEVDFVIGKSVLQYHLCYFEARQVRHYQAVHGYKLSKNSHFRRKNKGLLKDSAKREQESQSTDGSIIVQSEMTMIGLLLNPGKGDVSPEGLLAHDDAIRPHAPIQTSAALSPLALPVRLRGLLDGWMAAAIAYRDRQAAWLAAHQAGDRDLKSKRIYRSPIDPALERVARRRRRRRLELS